MRNDEITDTLDCVEINGNSLDPTEYVEYLQELISHLEGLLDVAVEDL